MFTISSYLSNIGKSEDGETVMAVVYFIIAECDDGRRFSHMANFPCSIMEYDSEFGIPTFVDVSVKAEESAEHLLARIESSGISPENLNTDYWTEVAPAYGSIAYTSMDMESAYNDLYDNLVLS